MLHQLARVITLGLVSIASAGCCCVQGLPGNTCGPGSCGISSCGTGRCGSGPLMSLAGCRGACGEVYVDEWISEPPTVDNCGPNCGGCSQCYQPVRNVLKLLWGRPYIANCDTGLCGPSCDGGCDSYGGDTGLDGDVYMDDGSVVHHGGHASTQHGSSCNCGGSHGSPLHAQPMSVGPSQMAPVPAPALQSPNMDSMPMPGPATLPKSSDPMNTVPQAAPDALPAPTPSVTPTSSARRLNPALSRRR